MTSASGATQLRTRLVLTMILGAIVPLGIIGLWTTRSASTSGRTLLRSQLEAQLAQTRRDVEERWARRKSDLLSLAENEPVRQALLDSSMASIPPFAQRAFAQMTSFNRIVFKDARGRTRWTLEGPNAGSPTRDVRDAVDLRGIVVRLPISDLLTGDTIGTIEASLRAAALFPVTTGPAPRDGPLTAGFPQGDGPIVPPGADDRLFRDEAVAWSGHHWLTVRRAIVDPPMDIAVAGALDSYVDPFRATARMNAAVLFSAAAVALIVVVVLTNRVAREVERELAQREALAAVGEFASELSHEVRNPLTAIRLDLQRVEELANDATVVRGIVPRVLRQVERLDRAVTGALRVSRGVSIIVARFNLRTCSTLPVARRSPSSCIVQRRFQSTVTLSAPSNLMPILTRSISCF